MTVGNADVMDQEVIEQGGGFLHHELYPKDAEKVETGTIECMGSLRTRTAVRGGILAKLYLSFDRTVHARQGWEENQHVVYARIVKGDEFQYAVIPVPAGTPRSQLVKFNYAAHAVRPVVLISGIDLHKTPFPELASNMRSAVTGQFAEKGRILLSFQNPVREGRADR